MNAHRTAVILFGVAVAIVIGIASVTTLDRAHMRKAGSAPADTIGLARPHKPLDRGPGQALPAHR